MRLSQAGKGAAPAEADLVFEDAQSRDDFARLADLAWPHHHTLDEARDKGVWQGDSNKAIQSSVSEEGANDMESKFQKHEISYLELQDAVFGIKSLEATLQGTSKSDYQNFELLRIRYKCVLCICISIHLYR